MSISMHLVGFRPGDDKWKKMISIWDDCNELGIEPPEQVLEFFEDEYPEDNSGMEVNIESSYKEKVRFGDFKTGYEIDISLLPKDIRILRFYQSC